MRLLVLTLALIMLPFGAAGQQKNGDMAVTHNLKIEAAANTIAAQFETAFTDDKGGINYPDLYNAIGSVAGYSVQMTIREGFVKTHTTSEEQAFVVFKTMDGQKFFYGPNINAFLLGDGNFKFSLWDSVSGAQLHSGSKNLLDLKEILQFSARTAGSDKFGTPRVSQQFMPSMSPVTAIEQQWPVSLALLNKQKVDSQTWSVVFAIAVQKIMLKSASKFDIDVAAKIVMETAIAMSKIDPETIK